MSLLEMLQGQIGDDFIQQAARQVGAKPQQVNQAVSAGVPLLVSALARNASSSGGANALLGALDRDHDGSILDDVIGFLGKSRGGGAGDAILGHVLGGKKQGVEQAIGQASGLDMGQVGQILAMVAPLIMGALGKQRQQKSLDAGGLADMLNGERRQVERQQPEVGGLLGKLLDQDGDGQIGDDLAKMGMSVLGNLFGGKR